MRFDRTRANGTIFRLIADILLAEFALLVTSILRPYLPFGQPVAAETARLSVFVYLFVAAIWVVASALLSIYEPRRQRAFDEAQSIFVAVTLTTAVLAGVLYFTFRGISRLQIITFYLLTLVLLIGYRLLERAVTGRLGRPYYARRKVLVLGAGRTGGEVMRELDRNRWAGLEPVGFLDDDIPSGSLLEGYPILGQVEEVVRFVRELEIKDVVVALPLRDYDRFFQLVADLQKLPVQVRIIPDYVKTVLLRTMVEEFAGVPMITLQEPSLTGWEERMKRALDLIVGSAMLALTLPLMLLIGAAIRLDTPGPVFYADQRVGRDGKLFWMHKFRSMRKGAEDQLDELVRTGGEGETLFKFEDDPRVTRVGRFLRRTSIDELPQLFNVLKGEMSMVGPRPELPWLVDRYEPWQWQRLTVPQGMTGWWQVNGRGDKPQHLHTQEDLFYIQHYSLLLDIRILWRTVGAVLRGRGAY